MMEHPLRVDEFSPSEMPPRLATEPAAPELPFSATAAATLPPLPNLPAGEVLFLRPSDPRYAEFLAAASKRKQLSPALRAVCNTERAVAVMVDWVRSNGLNFAVRCGGHSYEGFSQSSDVAIDVRGLNRIVVDKAAGLVTVGAGVSLFQLYQALAAQGLALRRRELSDGRYFRPSHRRRPRLAGALARPDLRQPATGHDHRCAGASAACRCEFRARPVLGVPRWRRRQFWRRDRVHAQRLPAEDRAACSACRGSFRNRGRRSCSRPGRPGPRMPQPPSRRS